MYVFKAKEVNPDAYSQTDLWYDGKGMPHLVKDLPYSYAKNIMSKMYAWGKNTTPLGKAIKARMVEAKNELSS